MIRPPTHLAFALALNFTVGAALSAGGVAVAAEGEKAAEKSAANAGEKSAEKAGEKPAEKAGEKSEGEAKKAAAPEAPSTQVSDHYVHHWLPMPPFAAARLPGTDQETVQPRPGHTVVIIFLASWCEPCQQLMPEFARLEKRYKSLSVDFVYMFAHDTPGDAQGFMQEFNLPTGYIANHDVLKTYHNPPLPTIYVGDRHGWLTGRYQNAALKDLAELDGFLQNLSAY